MRPSPLPNTVSTAPHPIYARDGLWLLPFLVLRCTYQHQSPRYSLTVVNTSWDRFTLYCFPKSSTLMLCGRLLLSASSAIPTALARCQPVWIEMKYMYEPMMSGVGRLRIFRVLQRTKYPAGMCISPFARATALLATSTRYRAFVSRVPLLNCAGSFAHTALIPPHVSMWVCLTFPSTYIIAHQLSHLAF